MRRTATSAVLLAVGLLLVGSVNASAQYAGRSTMQRGIVSDDMGIVGPPMLPPGIASLVLARAGDLKLTEAQRVAIEDVRRTQDSANAPRLSKLDSLRPTRLPAGGPNDLSPEQRTEAEARRAAIKLVLDAMNETNASAHQRIMAQLDESQRKKMEKLEKDARKDAEKAGRRRMEAGRLPFVHPDSVRARPTED